MNDMKNLFVLWTATAALCTGFGLSASPALAEGMHGVTETAKEVLVQVPKFCRPLKMVWEIRWEQNPDNENLMKGFIYADKGTKIKANPPRSGFLKVHSVWSGGETIHIPKFDARGKPIKINLVSILALGDEGGDFSKDNWAYESHNSRWVNGAMISPPVRVGTWGKCS